MWGFKIVLSAGDASAEMLGMCCFCGEPILVLEV